MYGNLVAILREIEEKEKIDATLAVVSSSNYVLAKALFGKSVRSQFQEDLEKSSCEQIPEYMRLIGEEAFFQAVQTGGMHIDILYLDSLVRKSEQYQKVDPTEN